MNLYSYPQCSSRKPRQTDRQTDRLYRVFNDYTDMTIGKVQHPFRFFALLDPPLFTCLHVFLITSPFSVPFIDPILFNHPILNSVLTFPFSVPVSAPLSVRFSLSTIFLHFRHYFSGLVVYSKKVTYKYECQPSNSTRTLISALLS